MTGFAPDPAVVKSLAFMILLQAALVAMTIGAFVLPSRGTGQGLKLAATAPILIGVSPLLSLIGVIAFREPRLGHLSLLGGIALSVVVTTRSPIGIAIPFGVASTITTVWTSLILLIYGAGI